MDQDYFNEQGYTATIPNQSTTINSDNFDEPIQQQPQEDEFQFQQTNGRFNQVEISNNDFSVQQNQALQKIRQEQEKIQQKLRQKANLEYEQKLKRKNKGSQQLEQFLQNKQRQKQQRKRQNIEKQAKLKQKIKNLTTETQWKKVANNIPLKQGEHPGKKNIDRMRESIINKSNDEMK